VKGGGYVLERERVSAVRERERLANKVQPVVGFDVEEVVGGGFLMKIKKRDKIDRERESKYGNGL